MLQVKSPALEGNSKEQEQVCVCTSVLESMRAYVCVGGEGNAHVQWCVFPDGVKTAVNRLGGGEFVFNICVCVCV